MPSISITDGLSVTVNAELSEASALAKYAKDLPGLIATGADLSQLQLLKLSDPAVHALDVGLSVERPIELTNGAPALTLAGDTSIHFEVLTGKLFSPDVYGDNLAIPDGNCAVRVGVSAAATPGVSITQGVTTFGLNASAGIAMDWYQPFSAGPDAPSVLDALKTCIGDLVLPTDAGDLAAIPEGGVATFGGTGSLKFSASANLLAIVNPLATVDLPTPLPALGIKQGASIKAGASWEIASEFQLRLQRVDATRVRMGWYRRHSSEFVVTASAGAGISAGTASGDLFPKVIGAISSDAQADGAELKNAGLNAARASAIEDAVKKAVSRKLEVALAAEFGSLTRDEAAFLYELDLAAMDDAAKEAVRDALRGNLSGLVESSRGITEVRSILTNAQASRFTFRVNLLGIFNFARVSRLAIKGTVTWTPSTGELVIVDEATASRIQTGSVNFGANEDKLRLAMAESFLITAAYRGSQTALAPPEFKSTHSYFRLDNHTSRAEMERCVMALRAVELAPPPLPEGVADFGRTTVNLEANYDDTASVALFLNHSGSPHAVEEYEAKGRLAMRLLIPQDGDDAFRLPPLSDDALWARMKDLGPANLRQIFPPAHAPVITADYLAIRWWSDTMHSTAVLVESILRPGAANSMTLRKELAHHLRDVAARAHAQFGSPWGLVAMFLASGTVLATGSVTGTHFVFAPSRPLAVGA